MKSPQIPIRFNIIPHASLGFLNIPFLSGVQTKTPHTHVFPPLCCTSTVQIILACLSPT